MPSQVDLAFLKIARFNGLLSQPQHDECVRVLEKIEAIGVEMRAWDICEEKGYLDSDSIEAVKKLESRKVAMPEAPLAEQLEITKEEDHLFAKLALHNKLVSPEQLQESKEIQARIRAMKVNKPLGEILVEKGYLSVKAFEAMLEVERRLIDSKRENRPLGSTTMMFKDDLMFGKIAIDNKLIPRDRIQQAMALQHELRSRTGEKQHLGELLFEKGWADRRTLEMVLRLQKAKGRRVPELRIVETTEEQEEMIRKIVDEEKVLPREKVDECRRLQADMSDAGITRNLGELLVMKGYLDLEVVSRMQEELEARRERMHRGIEVRRRRRSIRSGVLAGLVVGGLVLGVMVLVPLFRGLFESSQQHKDAEEAWRDLLPQLDTMMHQERYEEAIDALEDYCVVYGDSERTETQGECLQRELEAREQRRRRASRARLLDEVKAYAQAHPNDARGIVSRYVELELRFPRTDFGDVIRAKREKFLRDLEAEAEAECEKLMERVQVLAMSDRYDEALELLEEFPARLLETEFGAKLSTERARLQREREQRAEQAYHNLVAGVERLLGQENFAEALALYEEFPQALRNSEWYRRLVEHRRGVVARVEGLELRVEAERKKLYDDFVEQLESLCNAGDWEKALARYEDIPAPLRGTEWEKKLEQHQQETLQRYTAWFERRGEEMAREKQRRFNELRRRYEEQAEQQRELAGKQARAAAARLNSEWGIYQLGTDVYTGDVSKRLDVVFLSAGYSRTEFEDFEKVKNSVIEEVKTIDPYANYRGYMNFHYVAIDDPNGMEGNRARAVVSGNILTSDARTAMQYARHAPDADLMIVLCNVSNVRATGQPFAHVITIDDSGDIDAVVIHEMGHAFAMLADEYVDPSVARAHPEIGPEDEDNELYVNVTRVAEPRLVKWHYWNYPKAPQGHKVGCFEGAHYRAEGYYRPEMNCVMRAHATGRGKFCVVCFEQIEKSFYKRMAPIDEISPMQERVVLWLDEEVTLKANAMAFQKSEGAKRVGSLKDYWYVDGEEPRRKPRKTYSETTLTVRGSELGPGAHEVGLKVDFSNPRVRRDHGFLSSSFAWRIEVMPSRRPKLTAPSKLEARPSETVKFRVEVEADAACAGFQLSAEGLPASARFKPDSGEFSWTTRLIDQGQHQVVFRYARGNVGVERAVSIHVSGKEKKNFKPLFKPLADQSVEEGETLTFQVEAVDVDRDRLTYRCENLPRGAVLDATSGQFRWQTDFSSSGDYRDVTFIADDGRRQAELPVRITVKEVRVTGLSGVRGFDILFALRAESDRLQLSALEELKQRTGDTFLILEAQRLLRDRSDDVRRTALGVLQRAVGMTVDEAQPVARDGLERNLVLALQDIAPHCWHFSDWPDLLQYLERLVELSGSLDLSQAARKARDTIRRSLQAIKQYNASRQ